MLAFPEKKHAYISSHPEVCGGEPVIEGTRMTVRAVSNYILHQGLTPEELVSEFQHINIAQVYDALSYYYDHRKEIEKLSHEHQNK